MTFKEKLDSIDRSYEAVVMWSAELSNELRCLSSELDELLTDDRYKRFIPIMYDGGDVLERSCEMIGNSDVDISVRLGYTDTVHDAIANIRYCMEIVTEIVKEDSD